MARRPPDPLQVMLAARSRIGTWLWYAEIWIVTCRFHLPRAMCAKRSAHECIKFGFPGATPRAGGAGGAVAPCRPPRRRAALIRIHIEFGRAHASGACLRPGDSLG